MSTLYTGQLGGFGFMRTGGDPEPGDLAGARRGVHRHYRFHDPSGSTSARDELGGRALVGSGTNGQLPVFGVDGNSFTGMSLPEYFGDGRSYAHAVDGATAGEWAAFFPADEGAIEFWFQFGPTPFSGHYTMLVIGDPATNHLGPSASSPPFIGLQAFQNIDGAGRPVALYDMRGGASVSVAVGEWHHYRTTWSEARNYTRTYFDDVLMTDFPYSYSGSLHAGSPGSAAKLYIGGDLFNGGDNLGGANFAIEDLVISNQANDSDLHPPVYVSASSAFALHPSSVTPRLVRVNATTTVSLTTSCILTKPVRDSQLFAEVVNDKARNLRTSQVVAELIRTGNYQGRVSQAFVEILMDAPRPTYNVSATTSFNVSAASAVTRVGHAITVSAATSFGVSSSDTSRVGHPLPVSATSSILLAGTSRGYTPLVYTLSASTSLNVAANGTAIVHNPTPYSVSAATTFSVSPSAGNYVARILRLSASSGITLRGTGYAPTSFHVLAANTVSLNSTSNGHSSSVYVSASSGVLLRATSKEINRGAIYVSAATAFKVTTKGTEHAILLINVSAATSMVLNDIAAEIKRGPFLVSANSSLKFRQATAYTNPGPRFVTATTNLGLATPATFRRLAILRVSAQTAMALKSSSKENAAITVSALSDFSLTATGRQNRDLFSAATTALGLTAQPKTGNLKRDDALTTFTVSTHASLAKTGTEAASNLTFTDLAQAVVWMPWRRTSLTLPAGGNLPHS